MSAVVFRTFEPRDIPYVASTWVLSVYPWRGRKETESRKQLRAMMRELVALALYEADDDGCTIAARTRVVCAVDPRDDATIHGWAAARGTTLLYVYVPRDAESAGLEIRADLVRKVMG